jgi:acetyl esterase/lipase
LATAQTVTRNVVYTTNGGVQRGDVYEPAGSGPFAAIVYLHGGSWRSGNKGDFKRLATDLAAAGYVGFSVDYTLRPGAYPTSWLEARDAVTFLRTHAAEYRVDPARIVIAGASAGGELAALVALESGGPKTGDTVAPLANVPVAAAILLNGVYDLTGSYGVIQRYLGGTCDAVRAKCLESSPMQHIAPGKPPIFVGHGTSDHVVPYASAELFTKEMKAAGNPVTFFSAAGGPHMYFTKSRYYADNLAAVKAFLRQALTEKTQRASNDAP